MNVRCRIERLRRRIAPQGTVSEWAEVIGALDATLTRLDPDRRPMSREELSQVARDAALAGRPKEALRAYFKQP